MKSLSDRPFSS